MRSSSAPESKDWLPPHFWVYGFEAGSLKGATLIMLVAVVKAFLVGAIFMHVKYDWFKLYFLICPVFIMATMMVVVFVPVLYTLLKRDAAASRSMREALS